MVTEAPGRAAWLESITCPLTVARNSCAAAPAAVTSNAAPTSTYDRILVIAVPPSRLNGTVCKRFHYATNRGRRCRVDGRCLTDGSYRHKRNAENGLGIRRRPVRACAAGFANFSGKGDRSGSLYN